MEMATIPSQEGGGAGGHSKSTLTSHSIKCRCLLKSSSRMKSLLLYIQLLLFMYLLRAQNSEQAWIMKATNLFNIASDSMHVHRQPEAQSSPPSPPSSSSSSSSLPFVTISYAQTLDGT